MPKVRKGGSNLTIKEQGFIQDLVKGKQIRKAVKKNYNVSSDRNASVLGYKMLKTPRIQYAILDLMDKQGVSDLKLVDKLKKMLEAKKEKIDKHGDIHEVRDNVAQMKALDMAMKIKGAYAPERHEHVGVNLNLYQELSDEELDERIKLIEAREAYLDAREGEEIGAS